MRKDINEKKWFLTMQHMVTRYARMKANTPSRRMARILAANKHLPEIAAALAEPAPRRPGT